MPIDLKTGRGLNTGRTRFPKGAIPWNKGKTVVHSAEGLRRIGLATKERFKHSHPFQGKIRTAEERKKISDSLKAKSYYGNNNGYPENWFFITEEVFTRDNYLCQECGIKLARVKGKGQVQCHHIDYDTSNNDLSNLITLCASCHAKTGYEREQWICHYRSKIKRS